MILNLSRSKANRKVYNNRKKRRIPALCVTYSHLSDEKCLCQNVGLGSSIKAQHGRGSVGDEGDADHYTA